MKETFRGLRSICTLLRMFPNPPEPLPECPMGHVSLCWPKVTHTLHLCHSFQRRVALIYSGRLQHSIKAGSETKSTIWASAFGNQHPPRSSFKCKTVLAMYPHRRCLAEGNTQGLFDDLGHYVDGRALAVSCASIMGPQFPRLRFLVQASHNVTTKGS